MRCPETAWQQQHTMHGCSKQHAAEALSSLLHTASHPVGAPIHCPNNWVLTAEVHERCLPNVYVSSLTVTRISCRFVALYCSVNCCHGSTMTVQNTSGFCAVYNGVGGVVHLCSKILICSVPFIQVSSFKSVGECLQLSAEQGHPASPRGPCH